MVDLKRQNSKQYRCRGCGVPTARVTEDGTIRMLKYVRGEPFEVDIVARYTGSGVVAIECGDCRGRVTPQYFITLVHPTYVNPLKVAVTN